MIMIASRVLLGLGEGMRYIQGKFVKNWFPPSERGRANATWVVGLMAGPAVAMPFYYYCYILAGVTDFFVLALIGVFIIYCGNIQQINRLTTKVSIKLN